jgi:hypothetical protein
MVLVEVHPRTYDKWEADTRLSVFLVGRLLAMLPCGQTGRGSGWMAAGRGPGWLRAGCLPL